MINLKIGEIFFSVSGLPFEQKLENYKKFFFSQGILDFKYSLLPIQENQYQIESIPLSGQETQCFRYNSEVMFTDKDWKHVWILPPIHQEDASIFLIQAFYTHAVQRHMIQVHSSLIDYKGRGIMFLGPSGIGKTTQAERWNEYRGAVIINGDMVFVQETEDQFLGWGTPWHGSSPYCENASVPLEALVILKQSRENRIRRLEGFEMVAEVSNSVFYPTWLENGMDLCLETLDHLLTHVPVYLLENRADEEAVALLEQTLDQNKKE